MDFRKIDNIIDRFYNGESSVAEERILKEYIFQNENHSREFEVLRNYFRFTEINPEVEYPMPQSIFQNREGRNRLFSTILIYVAAVFLFLASLSLRVRQFIFNKITKYNKSR